MAGGGRVLHTTEMAGLTGGLEVRKGGSGGWRGQGLGAGAGVGGGVAGMRRRRHGLGVGWAGAMCLVGIVSCGWGRCVLPLLPSLLRRPPLTGPPSPSARWHGPAAGPPSLFRQGLVGGKRVVVVGNGRGGMDIANHICTTGRAAEVSAAPAARAALPSPPLFCLCSQARPPNHHTLPLAAPSPAACPACSAPTCP